MDALRQLLFRFRNHKRTTRDAFYILCAREIGPLSNAHTDDPLSQATS